MSHLTRVGEVSDENGMASTVLAEAVCYPGSSIAFAQLLSGMERSGLIEREVRGKRTYRITPAGARKRPRPARPQAGARRARSAGPQGSGPAAPAGYGRHDLRTDEAGDRDPAAAVVKAAGEFDYDELARRLLIQVVRRLAASPAKGPAEGPAPSAGEQALALTGQASWPLEETVASLEQKLASVQTRQRTLSEENEKLREQLHEAQRSLALVQEHTSRPRVTEQLNSAEGVLLDRLLWLAQEKQDHAEAETG